MADGAVLGFVILHGDFKHVVAANAHTVDLWRGFIAGPGFSRVPGLLVCLRLAHGLILARLKATRKYDEELGGVTFCNQVSNTFDNFTDANWPVKHGDDLVTI